MQGLVPVPWMRRLVALSLLVCLTASPFAAFGASAQVPVDPPVALAVSIAPHGAPIPMGESGTATATVAVTCPTPAVYTAPVQVTFTVESSQEWMQVQASADGAAVTFESGDCMAGADPKTISVEFAVRAQLGAPAFRASELIFTATAGDSSDAATWEEMVQMEGNFMFAISEDYDSTNGAGMIRGTATNNANGPIVLTFRLLEAPERGELELPTGVIVPARATDDNDTAPFALRLDQDGRGAVTMTVRMEAMAQDNASHVVSPGYDVRILAHPRGGTVQYTTDPDEELDAPVLSAVLFVLVLVAVLALARRRSG